jgi:putative glycosyltransferase (TIGR04372 family)
LAHFIHKKENGLKKFKRQDNEEKTIMEMDPKRLKKIATVFVNFFALPLIPPLFLLRKLFKIKFVRLRSSRIGHLASNTELFLRRRHLGILDSSLKPIAIATSKPCNEQLLKMFKRVIPIIQVPQSYYVRALTKILATQSILRKLDLFESLPWTTKCFYEFKHAPPMLSFTNEEKEKGEKIKQEIGVNDNWYICFHSRDPSYLNRIWKKGEGHMDFRNCKTENYLQAAEYITQQGGYALRMGAVVDAPLENLNNQNIIDYASKHRSDFGDIYLSANCKFFLGNTAGLFLIPTIFSKPIAHANLVPIKYPPFREEDLFIPMKFYSEKKKRMLTFKEILNSKILFYHRAEDYPNNGIKVIENTSEEIFDLAREMNERIDGTWQETEEDILLQKKYKALYNQDIVCYGFTSKIGALFLRKNKELLG